MPLEYIYARQHLESAGVVVASEFSCVSTLLSGALKVINPLYCINPLLRSIPFTHFTIYLTSAPHVYTRLTTSLHLHAHTMTAMRLTSLHAHTMTDCDASDFTTCAYYD